MLLIPEGGAAMNHPRASESTEAIIQQASALVNHFPSEDRERPQEALFQWLEHELKSRLVTIDTKMDDLSRDVRGCRADIMERGREDKNQCKQIPHSADSASEFLPSAICASPVTEVSEPSSPMTPHTPFTTVKSLGLDAATPILPQRRKTADDSGNVLGRAVSDASVNRQASTVSKHSMTGPRVSHREVDKAILIYQTRYHKSEKMEAIWTFLEDPESSLGAKRYAQATNYFVVLTVIITLIQTIDKSPLTGVTAAVLETIFDLFFFAEVLVRFFVSPSYKMFFFNPYTVIDLLVAAPLVCRASVGWVLPEDGARGGWSFVLLCGVPIIRLLKNLRHFEKFHLLLKAFSLAFEALPVLLYMLSVMSLASAALIYLFEPPDNIPSFSRAMWLVLVTMTTVGYGDVTPKSGGGIFIVSVLVVSSVLFMAMPLGIIGNAFTVVWSDRDRILLTQRTRDRLVQWGYTPGDFPTLFRLFDTNSNGELELTEFCDMMSKMKIGLSEDRIVDMFRSFDSNGSGTLDSKEFVSALFPGAYKQLYNRKHDWNLSDPEASELVRPRSSKSHDHGIMSPQSSLSPSHETSESARRGTLKVHSPT